MKNCYNPCIETIVKSQFSRRGKMKKKNDKIAGVCSLAAAICFFISAAIIFFNKGNMTVVHLCLGACFLCFSSMYFSKNKT